MANEIIIDSTTQPMNIWIPGRYPAKRVTVGTF